MSQYKPLHGDTAARTPLRPSQCFEKKQNSRIPFVHSSSVLFVHYTRKVSRSITCPSIVVKRESTRHRGASNTFRAPQILRQGPLNPTLKVNAFPEVTDLLCRLPLPTAFRKPEAANLGDLMRLWVRSGVQINLSFGFSRAVRSASGTSNEQGALPAGLTPSPGNLISRKKVVKKDNASRSLPLALPNSFTLPYVVHVLVRE